ncbi:MAG: hypothetical protein CBB60_006055, partial [Armatimonadetes bacterium Cent15-Ar3]
REVNLDLGSRSNSNRQYLRRIRNKQRRVFAGLLNKLGGYWRLQYIRPQFFEFAIIANDSIKAFGVERWEALFRLLDDVFSSLRFRLSTISLSSQGTPSVFSATRKINSVCSGRTQAITKSHFLPSGLRR